MTLKVTRTVVFDTCDLLLDRLGNIDLVTFAKLKDELGKTGNASNTLKYIKEWKEGASKRVEQISSNETLASQNSVQQFLSQIEEAQQKRIDEVKANCDETVRALEKEVAELKSENEELASFKSQFKSTLDNLLGKIDEANSRADEAKSIEQSKELVLQDTIKKLDAKEAELQQAQEKIKSLSLQVKEGNDRYLQLTNDFIEQRKAQTLEFTETVNNLSNNNQNTVHKLEESQLKYTELRSSFAQCNAVLTEKSEQLSNTKNLLNEFSNNDDKINSILSAIENISQQCLSLTEMNSEHLADSFALALNPIKEQLLEINSKLLDLNDV